MEQVFCFEFLNTTVNTLLRNHAALVCLHDVKELASSQLWCSTYPVGTMKQKRISSIGPSSLGTQFLHVTSTNSVVEEASKGV